VVLSPIALYIIWPTVLTMTRLPPSGSRRRREHRIRRLPRTRDAHCGRLDASRL